MIRRAAAGWLIASVAGAAAAQDPAQPTPPDMSFAAAVAGEIHAVVAFAPPQFTLSVGKDHAQMAFYGSERNTLEGVRCERQASFEFIALANLTGGILAGVCEREAKRVRSLATAAPLALESVLAPLNLGPAARAKAGLTATRLVAPNGSEQHAFPVVAIGHGVIAPQTVVLVQRGAHRAVIVQAETSALCENYGLKDKTPLCRDTRRALTEIARRLEARFAK